LTPTDATDPLRVAVFSDHFSPRSSGGVERVVWEVYRRLAQRGVQVLVVTALERGWPAFDAVDGMTVHAERIWDLSGYARAQVGLAPALFRSAASALETFQPHILHTNGLHFQSTLAAALANRNRRRAMVLTSHVGKLDALPQPTRTLTRAYEGSIGHFVLSRCTRLIAISGSVREHLVQLGIAAGAIDEVPNGVDHSRFHPGPKPERANAAPPLLMFVGRHMPNKGPQVFIEALGMLRQQGISFRAELLSTGPMRDRLESRTRQLGLADQVTFRGQVPDVAEEMRRADVVARPSFSEGMPLSLLEAMATGVCLVVSDVSGNYDLVRDGVNGLLVPPGRADQLAAALKRVISSPELRRSLAAEALADSRAYSWDRCADQTLDSLKRAVAEHGRARAAGANLAPGTNA
jgi:glycosyltransferase involved in cell wall biosynthesis